MVDKEKKQSCVDDAVKLIGDYQHILSNLEEDSLLPEDKKSSIRNTLESVSVAVRNPDNGISSRKLKNIREYLDTILSPYTQTIADYNFFKENTSDIDALVPFKGYIEDPVLQKALDNYLTTKQKFQDFRNSPSTIEQNIITKMRNDLNSTGSYIKSLKETITKAIPKAQKLQQLHSQTEVAQTTFTHNLQTILIELQKITAEQLEMRSQQKYKDAIATKQLINHLIKFLRDDDKSLNKEVANKLATALEEKYKTSATKNATPTPDKTESSLTDLTNGLFRPVEQQIKNWGSKSFLKQYLDDFNSETTTFANNISTVQENVANLFARIKLEEQKKLLDTRGKELTQQLEILSAEAKRSPYTPKGLTEKISRQQEKVGALEKQYTIDATAMDGASIGFDAVDTEIKTAQAQLTTAKTEYETTMVLKKKLDSEVPALLKDLRVLSEPNNHNPKEQAQSFYNYKTDVLQFQKESSQELLSQDAYNQFHSTLKSKSSKFSKIHDDIAKAKERIALATEAVKNMQKELLVFTETALAQKTFLERDTDITEQLSPIIKLNKYLTITADDAKMAFMATVEEYQEYKAKKTQGIQETLNELFYLAKIQKKKLLQNTIQSIDNQIDEFNKYTEQYPFLKKDGIDIDTIKKQRTAYSEFALELDNQNLTFEEYKNKTSAIYKPKQDYLQNIEKLYTFLTHAKTLETQEKDAQTLLQNNINRIQTLTSELLGIKNSDLAKTLETLMSFQKKSLKECEKDFNEDKSLFQQYDFAEENGAIARPQKFDPQNDYFSKIQQATEKCFTKIKDGFIENTSVKLCTISHFIQTQPENQELQNKVAGVTSRFSKIKSLTSTDDVTDIKKLKEDINKLLETAILQTDPILKAINNMLVFCGNLCRKLNTDPKDQITLNEFMAKLTNVKGKYIDTITTISPDNKTSFDASYQTLQQDFKGQLQEEVDKLKPQASPSLWAEIKLSLNKLFNWYKDYAKEYKTRFFNKTLQKAMKQPLNNKRGTLPLDEDEDVEPPRKRPRSR